MAYDSKIDQPVQATPPISQMNATSNPQTTNTESKQPLSQNAIAKGYSAPKDQAPTKGNAPITQEGGYYQSRATDLGLMEQSPVSKPLAPMSVSLGGQSSSPSYGTGGIMKMPASGFQKPNAASYQSGTSLTDSIPNIMADNGVQSSIGNITQPVSTGLMRGIPKISESAPLPKISLWDDSSVLDNI